jgi:chitinase
MSLRNVIYYNSSNDQISLGGIAQLPYTDVIIANLQPADAADNNFTLAGWGNAFDNDLQSNIQALQSAGKNVLISFGGANNANLLSGYQSYAQNVGALVDDIVNNWVLQYGFNGVDIDYEDDSGFDQPGQPASYDGAGFLVALTKGLYQALPSGQNIITHAPSPPFFDPQGGYYAANTQIAAYTQIWQQAGNQIAWINCQFYNNSDYDATAALKVSWYQQIAEIMAAPQQLLMGVSLDTSPDGDEGAETLTDVVQNVIPTLEAQFGSQFGGVMAWEFSLDQGGAWANGIAQALGASATPNLYVFRQGSGNDGQLRYSVFQDTNWGGDTQVQNAGMSGSPSAVVYNGNLYAFHQGLGFNGQLCYSIFDGANWSADGCLNLGMSGSPSAVLWKDGITVFHQGTGHNGQLGTRFPPMAHTGMEIHKFRT